MNAQLSGAMDAAQAPGARPADYAALVRAATDLQCAAEAQAWTGGDRSRPLPWEARALLGARAEKALAGARSGPPSAADPGARRREVLRSWNLEQLPEIAAGAAESLRWLAEAAGAEPAA